MSKLRPVGGRGKKPPWESLVLRYPAPLKPVLLALIDRFHIAANDSGNDIIAPPIHIDEETLEDIWKMICPPQKEIEIVPESASMAVVAPSATPLTIAKLTPDQAAALIDAPRIYW